MMVLYDPTGKDADFYIWRDNRGIWFMQEADDPAVQLEATGPVEAKKEAMNLYVKYSGGKDGTDQNR